jgi:hypothetical protein
MYLVKEFQRIDIEENELRQEFEDYAILHAVKTIYEGLPVSASIVELYNSVFKQIGDSVRESLALDCGIAFDIDNEEIVCFDVNPEFLMDFRYNKILFDIEGNWYLLFG